MQTINSVLKIREVLNFVLKNRSWRHYTWK